MGIKLIFLPIAAAVFALPGGSVNVDKMEPRSTMKIVRIERSPECEATRFLITDRAVPDVCQGTERSRIALNKLALEIKVLREERNQLLEQVHSLRAELARMDHVLPDAPPPPMPDIPVACEEAPATPVRIHSNTTSRG